MNGFFENALEALGGDSFRAGRDRARAKDYGNALALGDHTGAANMAFGHGNIDAGLQFQQLGQNANAQQAQADDAARQQRLREAQGTAAYFSRIRPMMNQPGFDLDTMIASDPQGFEAATGMTLQEWGAATRGGVSPQHIDMIIAKAEAEAGIAPPQSDLPPAPDIQKVGDALVMVNPDGTATEIYSAPQAGPAQMTEYQRQQLALNRDKHDLAVREFEASQSPLSGGAPSSASDFLGPQDFENPFWEFNGPPPGGGFMLTQMTDQMGPLDDNRPDDRGDPVGEVPGAVSGNQAEYSTYMGRGQGAGDADRLQAIQENAQTVLNTGNVRLDAMENLLAQGAPIGPMSGARATATRLGVPLMTDDELGLLSQFQAQAQSYALDIGQAMKGAFSDADRAFVQRALNADMRPEEAQSVINMIRATNDRLVLHADTASKWQAMYGGLSARDGQGRDFDTAWRDFQEANPLFERNLPPGLNQGGIPSGAQTATNPETGEKVFLNPQTNEWEPVR